MESNNTTQIHSHQELDPWPIVNYDAIFVAPTAIRRVDELPFGGCHRPKLQSMMYSSEGVALSLTRKRGEPLVEGVSIAVTYG